MTSVRVMLPLGKLRFASVLLLLGLVPGCPVDDRELSETEPEATGGTMSTGGATSSGAGDASTPEGGDPGEPIEPSGGAGGQPSPPQGCPDLDQNSVDDCDETVVENADFSFGIALWKPERDIIIRVEEQSVAEAETPPALSVQSVRALESDALVTAGASQCVVISGGSDYALYAQILIPEGQASGSGGLSALFLTRRIAAVRPAVASCRSSSPSRANGRWSESPVKFPGARVQRRFDC